MPGQCSPVVRIVPIIVGTCRDAIPVDGACIVGIFQRPELFLSAPKRNRRDRYGNDADRSAASRCRTMTRDASITTDTASERFHEEHRDVLRPCRCAAGRSPGRPGAKSAAADANLHGWLCRRDNPVPAAPAATACSRTSRSSRVKGRSGRTGAGTVGQWLHRRRCRGLGVSERFEGRCS